MKNCSGKRKTIRRSIVTHILVLTVLILAGCATFERRVESFETTTFDYENSIRWGYFQLAYEFKKPQEGSTGTPDFEKLEEIRVSTYDVLKSRIAEDKLQAHQTVAIKYYNIHHMVEKTFVDKQVWEFDREGKRWYLVSDFPEFP